MRRSVTVLLLAAFTACCPAGALRADPFLRTGGPVNPIAAWVDFCRREPAECATGPDEPAFVHLDEITRSRLSAVNKAVNHEIRPVTDMEHWGVVDRWDIPTDGKGDCEDFQLLKRRRLANLGLPRKAMRMSVVVDVQGEGHAVLLVATDKGDMVLDNKRDEIRPWHRSGYRFVKRENDEGTGMVALGPATMSPSATARR